RPGAQRAAMNVAQRQRDGEDGAASRPIAVGGDSASVQRHDVAHDRETEPEPAGSAAAMTLTEAIEDVRQQGLLDAGAGVAHGDSDHTAGARELDGDAPAGRRELERIGDEIGHDLGEAYGSAVAAG